MNAATLDPAGRLPGATIEARLVTARDHLQRRYNEPLTLDALAALAGMTRWNFVRAYHERFGITPHREMLDLRVVLAQRLLADPALSVEDVSAASGFGSRTALYRNFVRCTRVSPLQWRGQRTGARRDSIAPSIGAIAGRNAADGVVGAASAATGLADRRSAGRG